jgi:outer membrane protein TolC
MQDKGGARMTPGTDNNFSAAFVADLSLIDARNIANFKSAKLEERAARYQQIAAVEDTSAAAAAAYFFYERSLSALTVIEKSIELDEVLLSRARDRRAANVATDLDVTRAEASPGRRPPQALAAKTDLKAAPFPPSR